jgi:[protein-PII] uridylyltransferase
MDRLGRVQKKLLCVLETHKQSDKQDHIRAPSTKEPFTVTHKVLIDNDASRDSTLVEITGRDRPGLLCDLVAVFDEHAVKVVAAKIATYGEMAIDVFYIRDMFGLKIGSKVKIKGLEESLLGLFDRAKKNGQENKESGKESGGAL